MQKAQKLNITFEYEFGYDEQSLQDQIIIQAGSVLIQDFGQDIIRKFKPILENKIEEKIQEIIDGLIDREIPLYSNFGETKNETTTIKEMLFDAAKKAFVKDRVSEHAQRAVRSDSFRKTIEAELIQIRTQYEDSLKEIIATSMESFVKKHIKK